MNDLNEIREELSNLVFSGKKEEAIGLLQKKFGASPEEAEKLLKLAVKESFSPAQLFKRVMGPDKGLFGVTGCKQSIFKMIGITLGFIGIPLLIGALAVYFLNDYQITNSTVVIGTVTALDPYTSYNEPTEYTPIITYQLGINQYSFEAPVYSDTPEFAVGEQVQLFVSKDDPENVIIDTFTQRWLMFIIVGSIGFSLTTLMIVFLYMSRKKPNI